MILMFIEFKVNGVIQFVLIVIKIEFNFEVDVIIFVYLKVGDNKE